MKKERKHRQIDSQQRHEEGEKTLTVNKDMKRERTQRQTDIK